MIDSGLMNKEDKLDRLGILAKQVFYMFINDYLMLKLV
jgi:hypothetical protein